MHEIIETEGAYCLVLELISGGELFDQIAQKKTYSERDAALIAKQILSGVAHLHSHHFVHRDLKPENLLLSSAEEGGIIKVVDFGLTRKLGPETPHLVECIGSTLYMAPEVVKRRKEDEDNKEWGYGKPADAWAVGVIIYIMLCGWAPFNAFEEEDIYEAIETAEFSFPPDDYLKISDSAKDFISKLLIADTEKRMTCEEAIQHPWIINEGDEGNSLSVTIEKVKQFQARRKFRGAIKAVKAFQRFGILKTQELSTEESAAVTNLYSRFREMLLTRGDSSVTKKEQEAEAEAEKKEEKEEEPKVVVNEKKKEQQEHESAPSTSSSSSSSSVVFAAPPAEGAEGSVDSTPVVAPVQTPASVHAHSLGKIAPAQSTNSLKYSAHSAVLKRLGMTAEAAREASECFERWDKDGNGSLDTSEFFEALNGVFLGKGKSAAFVERFANMFFNSADANHNGSLSWSEFLEIYQRLKQLGL